MIAGGESGGFLSVFTLVLIIFMYAIIAGVLAGTTLGLIGAAWALLNFGFWIFNLRNAQSHEDYNKANAGAAIGAIIGFLGLTGLGASGYGLLIFGSAFSFLLTLI